jgi:hypothetical protein
VDPVARFGELAGAVHLAEEEELVDLLERPVRLTDRDAGTTTDYFFFASCKSEDTFAKQNLFYKDNYDFCGIFSIEEYVIFRTRSP